jgi:hypothetical protein
MARKIFLAFLCAVLILNVTAPALAAENDERTKAVGYVTDHKIFVGDANGNLNLDSGLTRAELAVLLVRLRGDEDKVASDVKNYTLDCYFTDVPAWAKPYVGYCADEGLMVGYSLFKFGPGDKVTPQQACTVILRHKSYAETDWSYETAISKAAATGFTPSAGFTDKAAVKRFEMAILIYKAETGGGDTAPGQVVGDGSGNISPYPITTKALDGSSLAREDFSRQANPAVFDDYYTRGIYNAIRQVVLDRDKIIAGADENGFNPYYNYPHAIGHDQTYVVIDSVLGNISAYRQYKSFGEPYVKNIWEHPSYCSATAIHYTNQMMRDVDAATDAIIAKAGVMSTTAEKVQYFNDYLHSRITYGKNKNAGTLLEIFTDGPKVYGVCSNYTNAFQYLCDKAGIPCVVLAGLVNKTGERHAWSMVLVDGKWLYADVTNNNVLATSYTFATDENPRLTEFAKEVIAPGSTK